MTSIDLPHLPSTRRIPFRNYSSSLVLAISAFVSRLSPLLPMYADASLLLLLLAFLLLDLKNLSVFCCLPPYEFEERW